MSQTISSPNATRNRAIEAMSTGAKSRWRKDAGPAVIGTGGDCGVCRVGRVGRACLRFMGYGAES